MDPIFGKHFNGLTCTHHVDGKRRTSSAIKRSICMNLKVNKVTTQTTILLLQFPLPLDDSSWINHFKNSVSGFTGHFITLNLPNVKFHSVFSLSNLILMCRKINQAIAKSNTKSKFVCKILIERADLPTPSMANGVINRFQLQDYLPKRWSFTWLLIPALLNQPVSRYQNRIR